MPYRQPIVSVLGHVDHGKTTFLDTIRGGNVASREAGYITQHIGATEVPLQTIKDLCGPLMTSTSIKLPGLLFIDTPGHHSFTTLRARGGALADLAVLMIDINEGLMPQTVESIKILQQYKTPFLIIANKVDRLNGWEIHEGSGFLASFAKQPEGVQTVVEDKIYHLIGQFTEMGINTDRFDRITDFTKTFAIIPAAARYGVGIPEVLMMLMGLAQRFLEKNLEMEEAPGEGTILEVKEEKGLGTTIECIIFSGVINEGDTIVVGTKGEPIVTKVRALLKPKPLDEIRDPRERFNKVKTVIAAAGVKISAPNLDGAISGATVKVVGDSLEDAIKDMRNIGKVDFTHDEKGIIVKADAIGSLEAMVFELKKLEVPLAKVEVGDISSREVKEASTNSDPLRRVILAFNVKILPDAKDQLACTDVTVLDGNIIYKILENYLEWHKKKKQAVDTDKRLDFAHPGMFKILPDCIFRISKPAVVGIRILAGRVRVGQNVLRQDGEVVGHIKSVQKDKATLKEAKMGEEVAISIEGPTVGRQIKGEDVLYVDLQECNVKELYKCDLSSDELDVLEKVCQIKRKSDRMSWGL